MSGNTVSRRKTANLSSAQTRRSRFAFICFIAVFLTAGIFSGCKEKTAEELYFEGKFADEKRQYEEAFAKYRKAAEKGYPRAAYQLGNWYLVGHGNVEEDRALAKEWLGKAAAGGEKDAIELLESMEADERKFELARELAERGDPRGQYILGLNYSLGLGVQKDPAESEKWIRKAAEQGYEKAIEHLKEYGR